VKTAKSIEQRAKSKIINQDSPQSHREHGEELDRINRITKHSLKIGGGGKDFTSQASLSFEIAGLPAAPDASASCAPLRVGS